MAFFSLLFFYAQTDSALRSSLTDARRFHQYLRSRPTVLADLLVCKILTPTPGRVADHAVVEPLARLSHFRPAARVSSSWSNGQGYRALVRADTIFVMQIVSTVLEDAGTSSFSRSARHSARRTDGSHGASDRVCLVYSASVMVDAGVVLSAAACESGGSER